MRIGLLMLRDENDILADTLAVNSEFVDCFYVLDGSDDYKTSEGICQEFSNCAGYWRDCDIPYRGRPRDGWRQFIYEKAGRDHGYEHLFLLLHGDEQWTFDPGDVADIAPDADGWVFPLPFAIPRKWDYERTAHEQLTEFMGPGWPEFRLFWGGDDVAFHPGQHFMTRPLGLDVVYEMGIAILHYPYRSLESQALKASKSQAWSPENYETLGFWDDERIAQFIEGNEHYEGTWVLA